MGCVSGHSRVIHYVLHNLFPVSSSLHGDFIWYHKIYDHLLSIHKRLSSLNISVFSLRNEVMLGGLKINDESFCWIMYKMPSNFIMSIACLLRCLCHHYWLDIWNCEWACKKNPTMFWMPQMHFLPNIDQLNLKTMHAIPPLSQERCYGLSIEIL